MGLHLPKDPGYYEIHPDYMGDPTVFGSHGHDHTWIWIILVVIVILCWKYPEGWEWLGTVGRRILYSILGTPNLPAWMW